MVLPGGSETYIAHPFTTSQAGTAGANTQHWKPLHELINNWESNNTSILYSLLKVWMTK